MLNNDTIELLRKSGFELNHALIEFENGKTLFKGLYEINYNCILIGSIRAGEIENSFIFLDKHLYRPIGHIETVNVDLKQIEYILENIKYYHFNSNLSELELNKHQEAIVNVFIKRIKRGSPIENLIERKNKLLDVWRNNQVMTKFIQQIDIQNIYMSINLPIVRSELNSILR